MFLLLRRVSLIALKFVRVKMLPFDNKSEFQVIIDMPEGSTLENTAAVTREIGDFLRTVPEVTDYQMYVGTAAPYNFNGLVRHYFLRRGPHKADIQVNLVPKDRTESPEPRHRQTGAPPDRPDRRAVQGPHQSGGSTSRAAGSADPGGRGLRPGLCGQIQIARQIRDIFQKTGGVVDVDWYVEADQPKYRFVVDKEKAALNGVSAEQVAATLQLALAGMPAGLLHQPREREDVILNLRLPREQRSSVEDLKAIKIAGRRGNLVALSELVRVEAGIADKSIYHKNLMPVVYVTADVAGEEESPVYAILKMDKALDGLQIPEGYRLERYVTHQPDTNAQFAMKWDGEMAYHLRGLPGPGAGLCGGAGPDLYSGRRLVSVL